MRNTHWQLALLMLGTVVQPACSRAPAVADARQEGPLRFDRALLLEETSETSANVSIGDVNDDGHLDVVLVKGRHWPLVDWLLIGTGTGTFLPARSLGSVADRSYSGVLVDIDIDGDLDVVVSNDHPDLNVVYMNNGRGEYVAGSSFGDSEWPTRQVSVADVDGDGWPDIVVANRTGDVHGGDSGGFNYVCFNRGAGRFDDDCFGFSREPTTTITPADFNSDGLVDLAVPHREGGQSHVYLNDAGGRFTSRIPFGPPDAAIRTAEAADVNGDGILDLVVIDEHNGAAVHLGIQDGSFGPGLPLGDPGPTPYALTVADLNDDGHVDVIVGFRRVRPVVHFGDGRGGFSAVPFGDDQGNAYGFAVGDIDEDGLMDIAMARSDAPNVLYFGDRAIGR